MPHPGRMTTQKAKDFKGTMRSLLAELGHYKFRLIAVIVFAVLSTIGCSFGVLVSSYMHVVRVRTMALSFH